MSCEEMQENLVRRLAGDLSVADARDLDRHFESCDACRSEAAELQAIWEGLGELPEVAPSEKLRVRFDAMLKAESAPALRGLPLAFPARDAALKVNDAGTRIRRWLPLAALLAFGLGLGWLFGGRGEPDVVALRQEVGELHELVAQALLARSSVSDRLQGVAYGREHSAADPGVAAALVHALASDPNVNVRLAALEALRPIASRDETRSQLIAVAARPDSPLVSLSVIDVLLEAGTPEARHDLSELQNDLNLDPVVRGYLRDRLGRSI